MAIPLTETFDDPLGRFQYYDTNDVLEYDDFKADAHKDIRTFASYTDAPAWTMRDMLQQPISAFQTFTMDDFADNSITYSEEWQATDNTGATTITEGSDPALGNRYSLRFTLPAAIAGGNSYVEAKSIIPVDLTDVPSDWTCSIVLPDFPALNIDLGQSYVDFITAVDISNNPTAQVRFTLASFSKVNQTHELLIPRSALPNTAVGVLLHFKSDPPNSALPLKVASFRMLSPAWFTEGWEPLALEIDTVTGTLRPTTDRLGLPATKAFPHIWRADNEDPGHTGDPRPINSKLAVNFWSGSAEQNNEIVLYFRGRREDFLTQLDLDGTDPGVIPSYGENQEALDARKRQPDYGQARYNPRPQEDLEGLFQRELSQWPSDDHIHEEPLGPLPYPDEHTHGKTQADLERLVDTISAAWVVVTLEWGTSNRLTIGTTETQNDEDRYEWPLHLPDDTPFIGPDSQWVLRVDIEDFSIRVHLYDIGEVGYMFDTPTFDSGVIKNDFLFKRRRGRVGWKFTLGDGDAYIDSIRSRGAMFAEILTNNYESLTPVIGARVFAGATPNLNVIPNTFAYNGATLEADVRNSRSPDGSVKVTASPGQGFQTDFVVFEDFENTEIYFDLYTQDTASTFTPMLINDRGLMIPLSMGTVYGNRWQTFRLFVDPAIAQQSGKYRLLFLQERGTGTYNVDNLYIMERSVAFAGRAEPFDPWARGGNPWTEFKNLVNNETNGVVFPKRGFYCQVRGQALKQDATIDKIYVKPKYAEVGNFTWGVNKYNQVQASETVNSIPQTDILPAAHIAISPNAEIVSTTTQYGTYTFDNPPLYYHDAGQDLNFAGTLAAYTAFTPTEWYWDFGDGSSTVGQNVTHNYTYPNPDTTVHLRVTDDRGRQVWASINPMLRDAREQFRVGGGIILV